MRSSATAEMPPAELVKERAFDIGADALRDLEALADERNVDLQILANEAFADLLKKHGRDRTAPQNSMRFGLTNGPSIPESA
jgi:hypothetical protein